MAKRDAPVSSGGLKLNLKRTFIIGFAFFGILLLWQVYDTWCPVFLSEAFKDMMAAKRGVPASQIQDTDVQYLVGLIMAFDNLAALILMPIFGRLSDKTHTKLGKRMPYILVGTVVCAIAFPFVPVLFHYHHTVGMIIIMAVVVLFAMMYRNPAVALMPDLTPKPLRSKANGIINIMGYIGGFFATVVGLVFVLSDYLIKDPDQAKWSTGNLWVIEVPFLVASVLMVVSAIVLIIKVRENELAEKLAPELEEGERLAAIEEAADDDKPMPRKNLIMLLLILFAEFFWFMSDNGVRTFMLNYSRSFLNASTATNMVMTILGGAGSIIGFVIGGFIAEKIGRKWTVVGGLSLAVGGLAIWLIFQYTAMAKGAVNPDDPTYNLMPAYLFVVWFLKDFGMSLVHLNSFPMVVELCSRKKVGQFTGYYYLSSMAAQTVTPILLGLILTVVPTDATHGSTWELLPLYALVMLGISLVLFLFVKNVKAKKVKNAVGLEGLGSADE